MDRLVVNRCAARITIGSFGQCCLFEWFSAWNWCIGVSGGRCNGLAWWDRIVGATLSLSSSQQLCVCVPATVDWNKSRPLAALALSFARSLARSPVRLMGRLEG